MRSTLMLALFLLAPPALADERVVVAVADFDVQAEKDLSPLGKGLAQMLITDLGVSESVRLVERARLRDVLAEIELQRSPYFDPKSAATLGKGIGAELVVTGQIFAEGNALRLDVRAIDVENAEIIYAGKVEGTRDQIFELEKQLAADVLAGLGAKLSPIAKKQIGKRGTKSLAALAHFGKALDADDRGAKEELIAELSLALKADPEFVAAKDRLSALEERVETLERSGSLILKPKTWRDHLHNFKVHRANADLVQAEKSLRHALELEPRRAELWIHLTDLPAPRQKEMIASARALDQASKRALVAHLASDLGGLRDAPDSAENPAFRAVLAIDLIGRRGLPFTLTGAMLLDRALAHVLDPKNRRHLEPMLVDAEAFFSLAKNLKRDRLDGRDPPRRWIEEMIVGGPEGKSDGASSAWTIELHLAERPSSPIEVKIDRVPLPPGEKPYPNEGLWESKHQKPDDPERVRAMSSGRAYGWYVNPGTNPFARGGIKGYAAFGASFSIPHEDRFFECEPATKSPTGQRCVALFTLSKRSVVPGPIDIEIRYRDAAGAEVRHRDPRFWIWEMKLAEFKTGLWMHSDPWYQVNPVDDRVRERLDEKQKHSPLAAKACANPPISHDRKAPLSSIHYDVDGKLFASDPRKYRAAILKRGTSAREDGSDACVYLGLPALTPGEHTICMVARRSNGSSTLEPECFRVEVPARWPQEGRKPRR